MALLERYDQGEHEAVLRELIRPPSPGAIRNDLQKFGSEWTKAGGPDQVRRRRLVAATFALEAASPRFWPEEVDPLVEWGCRLLRENATPDAAEHVWFLASVAALEHARDDGKYFGLSMSGGALNQREVAPVRPRDHVAHAVRRFPNEARFQLAGAILAEVTADTEWSRDAAWVPDPLKNSDEGIRRTRARAAIGMFDKLSALAPIREEAHLRAGYLWLTLREPATATTHFAMAAASTDPFVGYLAHFLRGRAADLSGQVAESEAHYRSALAVLPHAQSATTALAANLFLHGRRDEAYTLVQDAFGARRRPDDPWSLFGYGDFRFMPAYMAQLREAIR
ncbi:MAG TPA: hypothetical protein VLD67_21650 [Vicinamibacterales bacterium]|nr:hypothetical protein [Vicinamibacterales bacterium]